MGERRRDARDDRPVRERRSKAGNAARLADMATLSEPDPIEALFIQDKAKLAACRDEVVRLGTLLEECVAERDRLRVIVDLACAEHEALRAYMASEVTEPGTEPWVVWQSAREDCHDAVDEEVARRG